jgi:hypothetical protein
MTVSAPGVAADRISLNVEGCSITKISAGKYNVKPSESLIGKTVSATSSALADRGTQSLGSQVFRVKRVPDPQARLGNLATGKRAKQEILTNPLVVAKMDEGFVFNLVWTIQSFQISIIERGMESASTQVQGNQLPASIVTAIRNAAPKTVIQITGIRASSPGLPPRTLNDLMISIR